MTAATDPQRAPDDGDEWIVGIAALPTYVTENGEVYRPNVIMWMDAATELILDTTIARPQAALGAASAHLRTTARSPVAGRPAMPGRVRVASPELAEALRRESPDGIEVVCAPTPELDRALESLIERVAPNDEEPDLHYLGADASVDGTAAMFRAAARLYRTKPWEIVPSDASLIGITSEALGLRDAVVSVIGQAGQVYGFLLFTSLDDFHQFGEVSDRIEQGHHPQIPRHLALTYVRRAEVGPTLLAEIAQHRWEVASTRAYPVIIALDEDATGRNPTRSEMLRMEALAASLVEVLGDHQSALEAALDGGSRLELHQRIETSGGAIELEVSAPVPGQEPDDALLDEDGALDEDRVAAYRDAILRQFGASPEAHAEPAAHWGELLVDYAASYFGMTVMSLSAAGLREIVFELIPRKVSVEPTAAPAIVAGLRAFLAFLQREYPGSDAERCLASLEGNAAQRLARLLADPSNYGPAKAFVMGGQAAGFDMTTQAGGDAWIAHMRKHDLRLPTGFAAPTAPRRNGSAKPAPARRAKKTKRKAQRAARHKNRSR
jgi:hypothetical protein